MEELKNIHRDTKFAFGLTITNSWSSQEFFKKL